jgi:hypothetical protein
MNDPLQSPHTKILEQLDNLLISIDSIKIKF